MHTSRLIPHVLACYAAICIQSQLYAQQKVGAEVRPGPIRVENLKTHLNFLASPELGGRRGEGSRKAGEYLQQHFATLGLPPLFKDGYFQAVPGADLGGNARIPAGRNVGAIVPGSDPKLRDEYILLGAHYDHLGTSGDMIFYGADDNASGTAMLMEVARVLAESPVKPKRSVILVGFDLEERMLWGSRWFVNHSPVPLEKIKCVLIADMIGRSLGDLDLKTVFVMGSEHSPELVGALDAVAPPPGLNVARLGIDLIGVRSDYGPFWNEQVPFLFFSSGQHPDYHKPTDTADKIDWEQTTLISTLIHQLCLEIANSAASPTWIEDVPTSIEEVESVRRIAIRLLDSQRENTTRPLGATQLLLLGHIKTNTAKILDAGTVTPSDRTWLIRVAQLLLFSVL
jgi:hypothetical protein